MRNFLVAAFAALVTALITVACGGGSGDLCEDKNVRCEAPLSCDPDDGVCKCGGQGGVICPEGFACDPLANTCLSTRCAGVNCAGGTSCDVLDGKCKCGGTGGQVCAEGQICNPASKECQAAGSCTEVNCAANETCDPDTVQCVCGTTQCPAGQSCTVNAANNAKECVQDNCFGVSCLGNTTCDPADGRCKCNGAVCASGSVCGCPASADGGTCEDSARTCVAGSACANVTCAGGTTCDPIDGKCKCGGPGGPACGPTQVCSLSTFTCQGGTPCTLADGGTKSCSGGTSCDPEDGACKCGGRGGEVCEEGADGGVTETCVQSLFSQVCRPKCDPRLQNCPTGQYCYFDTTAKVPTAYCAVPSDDQEMGQGCNSPTACFTTNPSPRGLFCNGIGTFEMPGSTGFCRSYCDTTVGDQSCVQVPAPQKCDPLPVAGAPAGVGFCNPVN